MCIHAYTHGQGHTHTHTHTHRCTQTRIAHAHTHTGELLKYDNGRWGEVAPSNRLKLTKTEGQVWLSLYHLLLHPDCQQKYEFNSHNKSVILKVSTAMGNLTF